MEVIGVDKMFVIVELCDMILMRLLTRSAGPVLTEGIKDTPQE